MEKFIEVNGNWLFSDEHLVKTNNGWVKAKNLKVGDEIYNIEGKIMESCICVCCFCFNSSQKLNKME